MVIGIHSTKFNVHHSALQFILCIHRESNSNHANVIPMVPVICDRDPNACIDSIDRNELLVPKQFTVAQFIDNIRYIFYA